ncbi:hypothetical protein ACFL5V_11165 [Fibrobacterota bacterium]
MKKSVYREDILPFILLFSLLILLTLLADSLLHQRDIIWVGRYGGYFGTLLITLSFMYSLRKRKIIRFGTLKWFLVSHEYLGWFGGLMILIHGGIHFNGLLAWLAVAVMLVTIASGLTGRVLLIRSKNLLSSKRNDLLKSGMDLKEVEDRLFWDSTAVDLMKKWRSVHLPITSVFVLLALLHVIAVSAFWKW